MERVLGLGALGLAALATLLPRLKRRLDLSRAKHPSLRGHSRLASWIAKRVPYYEYDDVQFFRVDGAGPETAARRREGFMRLATELSNGRAETLRLGDEARRDISDAQFTSAYRVPFQFSRFVRNHLKVGTFVASSSGVTLTDPDGNRTLDVSGAYGVNVFGYDFYKGCMERASARVRGLGPVLGPYHPVIVDNVRRLRAISGLDEVSFHMSGTEAVMQAVRLARYHTERSHVVRFCGAYHGWWDDVQPGVGNPAAVERTYTLKEMDEGTLRVLRTRRDIACVLVNPLQALHPNSGAPSDSTLLASDRAAHFDRKAYTTWLQWLREVCTDRGIVLIFDEVFLGFRLARGGAQEFFGVPADIVTYGKTIAGGLPAGVVCGKSRLMKRFRENRPMDICFARGTFNSHPYVMAAMQEFLLRLDDEDVREIYAQVDRVWSDRAAILNRRFIEAGLPVRVSNLSSIWTVLYTEPSCYNWMFQYYLRAEGLNLSWIGTGRLIFSLNYSDEDFDDFASAFERAAKRMKGDGWWEAPPLLTNRSIHRRVVREIVQALVRRPSPQPVRGVAITPLETSLE
jgi:glutamate-1-semialdehyde 2,1-aminomutase